MAIASHPVRALDVSLIDESPLNPRKHWKDIEELAASLKLQQFDPVVVRPHATSPGRFELANGARRLRAARMAKLPTLEAKVVSLSDGEMLDIILGTGAASNVNSLTPLEEAAGYDEAMRLLGLTVEQTAARFGREVTHVHRRLSLLELPADAKKLVESGELPTTTAFYIARIPGDAKRAAASRAILHSEVHGGVMPPRAAELYINKHICRSLKAAPFSVEDADLLSAAGPCAVYDSHGKCVGGCPFRAGNNPETYGDVGDKHTCMHPECYDRKVAAARERVMARAAKDGKLPLPQDVNAEAFPEGARGLSWKSEYVAYTQPITRDLLKPEVSKQPTWKELTEESGLQVWIGFDQDGRAVDVVKLAEAIVAVPREESAIFTDPIRRRYLLDAKPSGSAAVPPAVARKRHKSKPPVDVQSESPVARPDDHQTTYLGRLLISPDEHEEYFELRIAETRAAFELQWPEMAEDCEAFCEYDCESAGPLLGRLVFDRSHLRPGLVVHECTHAALEAVAHKVMPSAAVQAMSDEEQHAYYSEAVPQVTQRLFEQVSALLATEVTAPDSVVEMSPSHLEQWQRAHAAGMSPQEIARSYKAPLSDVCGALALNLAECEKQFGDLKFAVEAAFSSAGLNSEAARDRLTVFATRVSSFADLTTPEQLRSLLRVLSTPPEKRPPQEESKAA